MKALGGMVWWKAVSNTPTWGMPGSSASQASMPLRLWGLCSGANWMHLLDRGLDLVGDQDRDSRSPRRRGPRGGRCRRSRSCPDHAVLGMQEQGQDHLDGHFVVRDLADLADLVLALRLIGDDGVARTDLLDDALGQKAFVLHADELKLDGRTAAVQDQNFHALFISSGRG